MLTTVVNNSPTPVYLDIVGNSLPQDTHVLGPKARDTFDIEETQLKELQDSLPKTVIFTKA